METKVTAVEYINHLIETAKKNSFFKDSDISNGYNSFGELYEFRKLYNVLAFRYLSVLDIPVFKSRFHADGQLCFDGKWFIVWADLPGGHISNHISNHYPVKDWSLFDVPVCDIAPPYDGHTSTDVLIRIREFIQRLNDFGK